MMHLFLMYSLLLRNKESRPRLTDSIHPYVLQKSNIFSLSLPWDLFCVSPSLRADWCNGNWGVKTVASFGPSTFVSRAPAVLITHITPSSPSFSERTHPLPLMTTTLLTKLKTLLTTPYPLSLSELSSPPNYFPPPLLDDPLTFRIPLEGWF